MNIYLINIIPKFPLGLLSFLQLPSPLPTDLLYVIIGWFAFLKWYRDKLSQYAVIFVWFLSLSILILRFIHVAFINNSLLFINSWEIDKWAIRWYKESIQKGTWEPGVSSVDIRSVLCAAPGLDHTVAISGAPGMVPRLGLQGWRSQGHFQGAISLGDVAGNFIPSREPQAFEMRI